MAKYILQAVKREGFRGVWRAGREWTHDPVEVEVLDQEGDPTVEVVDSSGRKRTALHPTRLGRESWRTLMADGRLSKTSVDAINVAEMEGELIRLRQKVGQLEGELDSARTQNQALEQQMTERVGPQPDTPVPFDQGAAVRRTLADELPPRAAGDDALIGSRAQADAFVPPVVGAQPVAPEPPATEAPAAPVPAVRGGMPLPVNVPAPGAHPLDHLGSHAHESEHTSTRKGSRR